MRVFKTKWFKRFARKEGIDDESLSAAIEQAEEGLIDADLGDNLIKQRVARPGEGKRGGYRTIIAFRTADRAVFMYGFAKKARENIDDKELSDLKELGASYMGLNDDQLKAAVDDGALSEVPYGEDEEDLPE
jgi:hypothetical protein